MRATRAWWRHASPSTTAASVSTSPRATRNGGRHWLAVRKEKGPFRRFEGEWHVRELGPDACKIEFELHYQFDSTLVGKLADTVFGRIADTMVDAFAQRADDVLGRAKSSPEGTSTPGAPS